MTPNPINSHPAQRAAFPINSDWHDFAACLKTWILAAVGLLFTATMAQALPAPLMENLGRGVVAVRSTTTQAYVGWRMLGTDPADIGFNLYRSNGGGAAVLLNVSPITATTDFVDTPPNFTQTNAYFVRPVIGGIEQAPSASYTLPASVAVQQYKSVPLQVPPGGTFMGSSYTYSANDTSVADLDGDGEYEIIVKWDPSNSRDTASTGYSGPCILDAYKLDGTRLWRINLGPNIRAGAHYTEFLVYDFDGDGKAELICKTADGSIDGQGTRIGTTTVWVSTASATQGRTLAGPEYLTVFNGLTGAAMQTITYIPGRDPLDGWGGPGGNNNNDSTGNRVDRFNAGIAWLDGVRPSAVMCRGYYGRSVIWAVDWRGGQLTTHWVFDSSLAPWVSHPVTYPYAHPTTIPQIPSTTTAVSSAAQTRLETFGGQGGHHLFIGDVDGDGKDEVVYHSMVVNSDGTGRISTGLRHGDAGNLADIIPSRPGLEVYGIHENEGSSTTFKTPGIAVYDASTGQVIWAADPAEDVGRGRAADIDPNFPGMETWGGTGGTRRGDTGATIYSQTPASTNMTVWWDADFLRELEDGTSITKWNYTSKTTDTLLAASGVASNNSTKSNPCLIADILGDWREEVLWRSTNSTEMRIYTTTIPATNRFWTFMHDKKYRASVAFQQSSYNQPTDTSFFVGADMAPQPPANIVTRLATVSALGSNHLWFGPANAASVSFPFDVLVEVLKNGAVVSSGAINNVSGTGVALANAVDKAASLALAQSLDFYSGDQLGFRISARVAEGVTLPIGKNSGTLRLWFDDAAASSHFDATVGGVVQSYYLHSGSTLSAAAGTGPVATADVLAKATVNVLTRKVTGGNPYQPLGTWSLTY